MNVLFFGCLLDKKLDKEEIEELLKFPENLHDISPKYYIFGNIYKFKTKKEMIEKSDINKGYIEWLDIVECMKKKLDILESLDKLDIDIDTLDIGFESNWFFIQTDLGIFLPIKNIRKKINKWNK